MGLFSNKKNPCVLCGEPTPRLFAKEACGGKLCGDCGKKISMQEELLKSITLDALKEHMAYREENARLHESFEITRSFPIDGEELRIDDNHKLFYITSFDGKNKPIFKFDELVGFAYIENMQSKFGEFISSEKLFHTFEESVIMEKGVSVVCRYTKQKRHNADSLIQLYKEEFKGIASSKNLLSHVLGVDDALMSQEKPIKQMYLTFEFDNPYWRTYRKNLLEPIVRNYNSEDKGLKNSGRREYIDIFERKLKQIGNLAGAIESILDA